MKDLFKLITVSAKDVYLYNCRIRKTRISNLIEIVTERFPARTKKGIMIKPIMGFEDEKVIGYKICVEGDKEIENRISEYIPFLLVKKG